MKPNSQVAIVTGAGSGIGRAVSRLLAGRGARVVVSDLDGDAAERVAAGIRDGGGQARAIITDVRVAAQVQDMVDSVVEDEGRIDRMFNIAGLGAWGDVRDLTLDQWRRIVDVNLWGAVHGSLTAYHYMARQGSGHIVNMASLAGLVPAPLCLPYATAKHGVVGFTLSLRAEGASLGVRVSAVCPGPVNSGFHAALERAPAKPGASTRPLPPTGGLDADAAARAILRGADRNRKLIVFPGRAYRLWLYWRFMPLLVHRVNRKTVERMRRS